MPRLEAKASTTVNVGTSSTAVLAENRSRQEVTIINDGANIVYLALNTTAGGPAPTAVLNSGVRLNANGGSWTTTNYLGPIAGIAVTGATGITVVEI